MVPRTSYNEVPLLLMYPYGTPMAYKGACCIKYVKHFIKQAYVWVLKMYALLTCLEKLTCVCVWWGGGGSLAT